MTPIMGERREVKTEGHRRRILGELLLQEGAPVGQGMKGVGSVATETEAVALDEEMIDEETVLIGDPLSDVTLIGTADVMVDSKRGATTSRGTIRGRFHAGSAHSSGPHWPQGRTGSIEARDLLPHRIR